MGRDEQEGREVLEWPILIDWWTQCPPAFFALFSPLRLLRGTIHCVSCPTSLISDIPCFYRSKYVTPLPRFIGMSGGHRKFCDRKPMKLRVLLKLFKWSPKPLSFAFGLIFHRINQTLSTQWPWRSRWLTHYRPAMPFGNRKKNWGFFQFSIGTI